MIHRKIFIKSKRMILLICFKYRLRLIYSSVRKVIETGIRNYRTFS